MNFSDLFRLATGNGSGVFPDLGPSRNKLVSAMNKVLGPSYISELTHRIWQITSTFRGLEGVTFRVG